MNHSNRNKILVFVLLTFLLSWSIWLPNFLSSNFKVSWHYSGWLHLLGGLGPFLSAVLTSLIFEGQKGIKQYFAEKFISLPSLKYLLMGLWMPLVFFLIPFLFLGIFQHEWIRFAVLGQNSKLPVHDSIIIWLVWCIFYGIGEEGGWRGFLLPQLSKRYSVRKSCLIVALIWAPWHLPLFFFDKDFYEMGAFAILGWVTGLVFGSLLLGWLVKKAHWNLWPVILWHGTFNFFTTGDRLSALIPAVMSMLVILLVLWITRNYDKNFQQMRSKV